MRKRRMARELVLQMLYGWEISGNSLESVLNDLQTRCRADEEVQDFATDLFQKIASDKDTLDQEIAGVVDNWEFSRVALIDRLILRMALCELLHYDEIPPKVTINEAIDLAKDFSTEQSGRFVNGILDSLYRKVKAENRIAKKGRGLM